jgi:hypothetical protein
MQASPTSTIGNVLTAAVAAAPTVIAGVEYLFKEAPSATKQKMAIDALTVLTSSAALAEPAIAPLSSEIQAVLAALINVTVAGFNAAGTFAHKASAPAAA